MIYQNYSFKITPSKTTSSKLLLYKRLLSTLLSQIVIIMIFSWVKTNPYHRHLHQKKVLSLRFFSIRVSFTDTDNLQGSGRKEGTIFYSTLPLPPALEHSDIYLQLCTWDDYHIFLIAGLIFTRLLLDGIYQLIKLLFDWLMMWYWFSFVCLLIWF